MNPYCSPGCHRAAAASKPKKQRRTQVRESTGSNYAKTRLQAVLRDECCRWCSGPIGEVHHVKYRSHGVDHGLDNLLSLCVECHDRVHADGRFYRPLLEILTKLPTTTIGMHWFREELAAAGKKV